MVFTAILTIACGGGDLVLPGPGEPTDMGIRVVGGDGQSGLVGELLTAPVVVEVTFILQMWIGRLEIFPVIVLFHALLTWRPWRDRYL